MSRKSAVQYFFCSKANEREGGIVYLENKSSKKFSARFTAGRGIDRISGFPLPPERYKRRPEGVCPLLRESSISNEGYFHAQRRIEGNTGSYLAACFENGWLQSSAKEVSFGVIIHECPPREKRDRSERASRDLGLLPRGDVVYIYGTLYPS